MARGKVILMTVSDILHIDAIDLNLVFSSRVELYNKLVDLVCRSANIINKEEIKYEVIKRENIKKSIIKDIIVVPHAKCKSVQNAIAAFAVTHYKGVPDSSLSKIKLAILIVGNENNTGNYLRIISKLGRMLNEKKLVELLIKTKNKEAIIKIFSEYEDSEE